MAGFEVATHGRFWGGHRGIWRARWQFDRFDSNLSKHAQEFSCVERIPIMDEITLTFEKPIDAIGEIACDLSHPQSICLTRNSTDLNSAPRQLHKEQHNEALESTWRPDLNREKVTGNNLVPMAVKEFFPCRLPAPFRGGFNSMPS